MWTIYTNSYTATLLYNYTNKILWLFYVTKWVFIFKDYYKDADINHFILSDSNQKIMYLCIYLQTVLTNLCIFLY